MNQIEMLATMTGQGVNVVLYPSQTETEFD